MLVTIGSMTTAERLARIIERSTGNPVAVVHTPASINKGGCSYSVRFNDRYENDARRLIREYNIPAKRFYREGWNGAERVYHDIS
ncbi:MAG: DUF3343 domain-containing protein [Oscillospiraceae bacterium]|nr:DUF3343 domain-containing protein [Oscillospiraceae bacterium]